MNWSAVTSVISAMTAIGALIFTALSLNATRDQVAIAEQGQITDRYSRTIEQLGQQGHDRVQIRLGAIYALERLAHDSPRDQPTIIEVLAAFVRSNVARADFQYQSGHPVPFSLSCPTGTARSSSPLDHTNPPTPDVQAALAVLGRRDIASDNAPIDLTRTCLVGADLAHLNLTGTDLSETYLHGTDLSDANISDVDLSDADLRQADGEFRRWKHPLRGVR